MLWENTPFVIPLIIVVFIMIGMIIYALRHQDTVGAIPFIGISVGVIVWCSSYGLELLVPELPTKIIWAKIAYLGVVTIPVAWLALALQYTQRVELLTLRNTLIALIVPAITISLVFTNEQHGLIWDQVWLEGNMMVEYGNWWWVFMIYSYVFVLSGMILFILSYFRTNKLYRGQAGIMILSTFAPWVGNILWITGNNPIPELDLTPFGFAASAILFGFGLFRFRLLDLAPVARDKLVEIVSDGMLVIDQSGRLMDFNPATKMIFETVNQRSINLTLGQPLAEILGEWPALLSLSQESETVSNAEIPAPAQLDGRQKYYAFSQSPLIDRREKVTGYLLVLRDISSQKEAEQKLRQLNADKDKLFSVISHDLRGPFNPVMGFGQLLMAQGDRMDGQEVKETGELIYTSSRSAYELLESLLQWSRLQTGRMPFEPEPLSVLALFEKTEKLFHANAQNKKIDIMIELSQDFELVADANMIEAILRNFVSNALKFTPESGRIIIGAERGDVESKIYVQDNGVGIDPEQAAKLFRIDEHLTTKGTAGEKGTGLGLILCKEFVDRHGGRIWVDSQPDQGATFCFAIPLQLPPHAP